MKYFLVRESAYFVKKRRKQKVKKGNENFLLFDDPKYSKGNSKEKSKMLGGVGKELSGQCQEGPEST